MSKCLLIGSQSVEDLLCALRAACRTRDLSLARSIYERALSCGLETDKAFGSRIVQLFVACESLADARLVFDRLSQRDVLSWTSLISGHVESGQIHHAFTLYRKMQEDHVYPTSHTFVALLKACALVKNIEKGRELHMEAVQNGFERNPFVVTALIHMYAKFGLLLKAQEAFDMLPVRDSVVWNTIIGSHVENGASRVALYYYEKMQQENTCPTAVTFLTVLKACNVLENAGKGHEIHSQVVMRALENDVFISSALIDMYVKLGSMADAEKVFTILLSRTTISWNTLLAGYTEQGEFQEVFKCFENMQSQGVAHDAITFVYSFKACGAMKMLCRGRELHTKITHKGLENSVFLASILVDMYGKCDALAEAQNVFNKLHDQDVVSWTTIISGYVLHGYDDKALETFDEMDVSPNSVTYSWILKSCNNFKTLLKGQRIHMKITEEGYDLDVLVSSALIGMYTKHGLMAEAQQIFNSLPKRDIVSWNALLSGYSETGCDEEVLNCVSQIQSDILSPDAITFTYMIKACSNLKSIILGQDIHSHILITGFENDMFIDGMLIDMYAKCSCLIEAWRIFYKSKRDVVVWNALITGLIDCGCSQDVTLEILEQMRLENISADHVTYASVLKGCSNNVEGQKLHNEVLLKGYDTDSFVGSSLVDQYMKCGLVQEALDLFQNLPLRDDVLWNVLLGGYVDNGRIQEAHVCLHIMQSEKQTPNSATMVSILKACEGTGAMENLNEAHTEIIKQGFDTEPLVNNTLMDVYGKCGCIEAAQTVFDALVVRDVTSWNTMIKGFAMNHDCCKAVEHFYHMLQSGIKPDATTFTCLLTACSRASLLREGQEFYQIIGEVFGSVSSCHHFVCLVDLLARSGCLYEAERFAECMPWYPSKNAWRTILSASKTYEEPDLGSKCFLKVVIPYKELVF